MEVSAVSRNPEANKALIEIKEVSKTYQMGEIFVHALAHTATSAAEALKP